MKWLILFSMNTGTKFLIFFLFSSVFFQVRPCSFKSSKKLGVLSGGLTLIIKELGLLSSSRISYLPRFALTEEERKVYRNKAISVGIFLSPKISNKMKGHHILFDESLELEKQLKRLPDTSLSKFSSRGKNPFEAITIGLEIVLPLVENCEKEISNFRERVKKWQKAIDLFQWREQGVLFFLGELKKNEYPEMMMVRDGFVDYLLEKRKIFTYPSSLPYVIWSEKILKNFLKRENIIQIGLYGSKISQVSSRKWNMGMEKMFIPGVGQVKFLLKFIDFFKR